MFLTFGAVVPLFFSDKLVLLLLVTVDVTCVAIYHVGRSRSCLCISAVEAVVSHSHSVRKNKSLGFIFGVRCILFDFLGGGGMSVHDQYNTYYFRCRAVPSKFCCGPWERLPGARIVNGHNTMQTYSNPKRHKPAILAPFCYCCSPRARKVRDQLSISALFESLFCNRTNPVQATLLTNENAVHVMSSMFLQAASFQVTPF